MSSKKPLISTSKVEQIRWSKREGLVIRYECGLVDVMPGAALVFDCMSNTGVLTGEVNRPRPTKRIVGRYADLRFEERHNE